MQAGVDVFRTYVDTWYDGTLPQQFFADDDRAAPARRQICSLLVGYMWDDDNPFARHHRRRVRQAARLARRAGSPPA